MLPFACLGEDFVWEAVGKCKKKWMNGVGLCLGYF